MKDLLEKIACTDEEQIHTLLDAVLSRYTALYPDWEISTISLQKTGDRNRQIDLTIHFLEQMKHRE